MTSGADPVPEFERGNPFTLLAYVLFRTRHSLEDEEESGRPPRWVRISRARTTQGESDYIGKGVKAAVDGFASAITWMAELTLDIREALVQTDAAKAVAEVSLDLLSAASDDTFVNGVRTIVGAEDEGAGNPVAPLNDALQSIKDYLDYIPEPHDVDRLGHELYRLLAIVQIPLPTKLDATNNTTVVDEDQIPPTTRSHVNIEQNGKLRLLQWSFENSIKALGLGEDEEKEEPLVRYGSRRLWETADAKLPQRTTGTFEVNEREEIVFDFIFNENEEDADKRTLDLAELHNLLDHWGYNIAEVGLTAADRKKFTAKTTKMITMFQQVNRLNVTGRLDNATINLLINLDFDAKNLRRAKPYDAAEIPPAQPGQPQPRPPHAGTLALVNPDADHPQDESLTIKTSPAGLAYYEEGQTPPVAGGPTVLPAGKGWISDIVQATGEELIRGFVAMHSRPRSRTNPDHFEGGRFSEGEASSGCFFFCARFTEPWIAGRTGDPGGNALFGPHTPATKPGGGEIARMYQWLDIRELQTTRPSGMKLYITASVLQRSLFTDRGLSGRSDDGRICLEAYGPDVFDGDMGARRTPSKPPLVQQVTDFYPNLQQVDTAMLLDDIARKRNWKLRKTAKLVVPPEATGLAVVLEGRHRSAWDIDAYFDDVKVDYAFGA